MKIILLVILTTGIAIASIAYAKSHKPEKIISRVTEKLSLNETQQNHFRVFIDEKKALRMERRKKHESRKQQRKEGKNRTKTHENSPFVSLLSKDSISVEDVNNAIDQIYSLRNENVIAAFVTFYNSLDNHQREKITPMSHKMLHGSTKHRRM